MGGAGHVGSFVGNGGGRPRCGLDALPLDGLFELVALVVAGTRDRYERTALRGPNNEEPTVGPAPVNGHLDCPVGGRWFSPWTVRLVPQGRPWDSPRGQVSGWTPFPSAASVRRTLSPVVTRTWAWCMSRSTRAEAMVRGMSSSKPLGCRFDEMATERRS